MCNKVKPTFVMRILSWTMSLLLVHTKATKVEKMHVQISWHRWHREKWRANITTMFSISQQCYSEFAGSRTSNAYIVSLFVCVHFALDNNITHSSLVKLLGHVAGSLLNFQFNFMTCWVITSDASTIPKRIYVNSFERWAMAERIRVVNSISPDCHLPSSVKVE